MLYTCTDCFNFFPLEASKVVMQYVAAVSGKGWEVDRVKEQLLQSNPVLEGEWNKIQCGMIECVYRYVLLLILKQQTWASESIKEQVKETSKWTNKQWLSNCVNKKTGKRANYSTDNGKYELRLAIKITKLWTLVCLNKRVTRELLIPFTYSNYYNDQSL